MSDTNRADDQATGIGTVDPSEVYESLLAYEARPINVEETRVIEVMTWYDGPNTLSRVEVFLGDLSRRFEVEDGVPVEALDFLSALDSAEPKDVRDLFANGVQHDIPRGTMIHLNDKAIPYAGDLARIVAKVTPELQKPMYRVSFADGRPDVAYFTYEFEIV